MPARSRSWTRPEQLERAQQLVDRRRLPAGDHEGVDRVELALPPDRHGVRTHGLERVHVLAHVSLQGEDSDGHGHDGRV